MPLGRRNKQDSGEAKTATPAAPAWPELSSRSSQSATPADDPARANESRAQAAPSTVVTAPLPAPPAPVESTDPPGSADPDGTSTESNEPAAAVSEVEVPSQAAAPPTPVMEVKQLPPHLVELKMAAQEALIQRMGSRLYDRSFSGEQIEKYVGSELSDWLLEQGAKLKSSERDDLTAELLNDVLRHGPIEPFLNDDSVSEVMVNGLGPIYVERAGKLIRTSSRFLSDAHLRQIIERIVSKVGRRIDESSPMVDARLPDGSRVNAVIPPLAVDGPSLTIRKFSAEALTVDDLISYGTLSPQSVEFISSAVRGRTNVLVSGGTGTGKTTLLNVLSNFIPDDERIVTLEDSVELQLRHEHLVRLESRPPNVEGKGQISIRDLVRNSLRMRPDRIIIGECRSGEALDMLQAMNTGHDGSLSTLHANGPRDAVSRLETLCLMAGMDLPIRAIREQIAAAVDLIVHTARLRDGTRRVTHISEVIGMDGESVTLSDIYTFDFDAGLDDEGRYVGLLKSTGVVPKMLEKLREHGEDIDPELFVLEGAEKSGAPWP